MSEEERGGPVREDLISTRREAAGFILEALQSGPLLVVRGMGSILKLAARFNVDLVDVVELARERAEGVEAKVRSLPVFRASPYSDWPDWYVVDNLGNSQPEGHRAEWAELWRKMTGSSSTIVAAIFRRCAMRRVLGGGYVLWSPRNARGVEDFIELSEDEGRALLAQIAEVLDLRPAAAADGKEPG